MLIAEGFLDSRALAGFRGIRRRLFFQAVEEPEPGFDLTLLRTEDPVFTRTAVGRRELTLAPYADADVPTGLIAR